MATSVSNWEKFKILLWKNWILQLKHKRVLILELMVPAIFFLILQLARLLSKIEQKPITIYPEISISNIELFKKSVNSNATNLPMYILAYSPANPYLDNIIREAVKSLQLFGYLSLPNARSLENKLLASNYLAGVQFDDKLDDITNYPQNLSFSLRFPSELRTAKGNLNSTWLTQRHYPENRITGPRNAESIDDGIPVGYVRESFIPIQHAISMSYLKLAGNVVTLPEIVMQRFPYPAYPDDKLLRGLHSILAFFLLLSFIYPCSYITKYITVEKEKQLKEVMKIMGMPNWIHWAAWFIKSFLMLALSCLLIVYIMKLQLRNDVGILTHSSWTAIFFFLLVYTMTSICFCFMIAVFFSKANVVAAISAILWFMSYFPARMTYNELHTIQKLGWCLLSNTAMVFGFNIIAEFEGTGEGLQWSNIFEAVNIDDNLSLGAIMLMMLLDAVIYMIICVYAEQIFPGKFGVPRKWNFPFTHTYWSGEKYNTVVKDSPSSMINRHNPEAFEQEPKDKYIGIQARNLKKKFGDNWAVKGLSMNMYEDEITVLLGHNGAGKTTTISMLAGMFPPTAGSAIINGHDIRKNIEGARKSMGICPQHNVLFDDMSVANHIVFFSRLKGMKGEAVELEVDRYLAIIKLGNKANWLAKTLSGGMKRKLSICCALCGGTKVVLCDEPSSGMDPAARRQLWDLLQAEKYGRTLLLTTHFLDEADVLGDRVAIMCDGELKCYGTSFFLKKRYGSGYRLICVKRKNCRTSEVTSLLQKYIPSIQPASDVGAELTYQLPDSMSPVFEKLFRDLEAKSKNLGLDGYGVGISTLEEVFMKVGAENLTEKSPSASRAIDLSEKDFEFIYSEENVSKRSLYSKGTTLLRNQCEAMFLKKRLYTWRSKLLFLLQNLLPVVFVIVTALAAHKVQFAELPPMTMSLTQYPTAVAVLEVAQDVAANSIESRISKEYAALIRLYGKGYTLQSTKKSTFKNFILELGKMNQAHINSHYLAAATIKKGKLIAWLNNQPLHTAPMTLNLLHKAMAKALIGPSAEIIVTNHPLPYSADKRFYQLETGQNLGATLAVDVYISMSLVSAFYCLFLIKENKSRSKLLQFIGGVKVCIFWLTHLLWDLLTFTFTSMILIIVIACLRQKGYSTFDDLIRYFALLLSFGFASLPVTYFLSGKFTEPSAGFSQIFFLNILTGIILFLVSIIMRKAVTDILIWVFRLFPHFSLAMGWNNLYVNSVLREVCDRATIATLPDTLRCELIPDCCILNPPYFGWNKPGILPEIVFMLSAGLLFLILVIVREYRHIHQQIDKLAFIFKDPPRPRGHQNVDEDVSAEKRRIRAMSLDEVKSENLVLDRLTKYYKNFLAVNRISLCVKKSECFGLLGVNGAGKTATFKMMTGDERISFGSAYVKGKSIRRNINKVFPEIGYCPQFDALLENLTGRETLYIFCLLRGVPKHRIRKVSDELAECFGFMKYMDKPIKVYSGGNKRKLSTAIAVIGNPSVIYLDEPTTGIDPAARRQLWNMVCQLRDSGKSIVLTSHSMEECEALCTRLAIMVNGEFMCIGSVQHLKNKYSKGFVLKIKMKSIATIKKEEKMKRRSSLQSFKSARSKEATATSSSSDELSQNTVEVREVEVTWEEEENKDEDGDGEDQQVYSNKVQKYIEKRFPSARLKDSYQGLMIYNIPLTDVKWSEIFGYMERNRTKLNIEDYSITQTTLEEIFVDFAKYQFFFQAHS